MKRSELRGGEEYAVWRFERMVRQRDAARMLLIAIEPVEVQVWGSRRWGPDKKTMHLARMRLVSGHYSPPHGYPEPAKEDERYVQTRDIRLVWSAEQERQEAARLRSEDRERERKELLRRRSGLLTRARALGDVKDEPALLYADFKETHVALPLDSFEVLVEAAERVS